MFVLVCFGLCRIMHISHYANFVFFNFRRSCVPEIVDQMAVRNKDAIWGGQFFDGLHRQLKD